MKDKIQELFESGDFDLAIQLCEGAGIDAKTVLLSVMDENADKQNIELGQYQIYQGRGHDFFFFWVNSGVNTPKSLNTSKSLRYRDWSSPAEMIDALLEYHNLSEEEKQYR
tara:strand:+ start:1991 stop:2323 length:333 start_codon:yes stop_codon:yes gene_type:complete